MEKNLTVQETAKILDKTPQFVRIGLQRNILPFGYAVLMDKKYSYHISKKKLEEYIGEIDGS
jgi:hypothetical protein